MDEKKWKMLQKDFANVARECLQVVLVLLMGGLLRLSSHQSKGMEFKILVPITVGKDFME